MISELLHERSGKNSILYRIILILLILFLTYLLATTKILESFGLGVDGPLTGIPTNAWSVVSTPILIIGFICGFVVYSRFGSRVGGVVAVPLAVMESLAYPLILPFLIIGSVLSYLIGLIIFEEFLIYGRRLFYVFLVASVFVMTLPVVSKLPHAFTFSTILPGIIAYNMHVEKGLKRSIAILLISYASLFLLGLLIIDAYRMGFYG